MQLNESQTRALLINPLLVKAEWKLNDHAQVGFEIPVEGYDPKPWNGITVTGERSGTLRKLAGADACATSADAARVAREKAEAELAELQSRIAPLEKEINQLTRQFWVTKEKVVAEKYDLSASRYRQVEQEEVFYEQPAVTLERMRQLEHSAESDVAGLEKLLAKVRPER